VTKDQIESYRRNMLFTPHGEIPKITGSGNATYVDGSLNWRCRYFKTSGASLQRPAVADPQRTTLNDNGSNLAWVLASLMTEHPTKFQEIVDSLTEESAGLTTFVRFGRLRRSCKKATGAPWIIASVSILESWRGVGW
jgi:predicted ATPase